SVVVASRDSSRKTLAPVTGAPVRELTVPRSTCAGAGSVCAVRTVRAAAKSRAKPMNRESFLMPGPYVGTWAPVFNYSVNRRNHSANGDGGRWIQYWAVNRSLTARAWRDKRLSSPKRAFDSSSRAGKARGSNGAERRRHPNGNRPTSSVSLG